MSPRVDTTATERYRWPPLYPERVALLPILFAILALWMEIPFALPVALLGASTSWAVTYLIASRRRGALQEVDRGD